jgi:hypothetical protein
VGRGRCRSRRGLGGAVRRGLGRCAALLLGRPGALARMGREDRGRGPWLGRQATMEMRTACALAASVARQDGGRARAAPRGWRPRGEGHGRRGMAHGVDRTYPGSAVPRTVGSRALQPAGTVHRAHPSTSGATRKGVGRSHAREADSEGPGRISGRQVRRTAAGEFVKEEMDHIREGKHGARSRKQAVAIGCPRRGGRGFARAPPRGKPARRPGSQPPGTPGPPARAATRPPRAAAAGPRWRH